MWGKTAAKLKISIEWMTNDFLKFIVYLPPPTLRLQRTGPLGLKLRRASKALGP